MEDVDRIRWVRSSLVVLIVVAVTGAVLGLVLVQRMGRTYEDALVTASEGAATAASMAAEAAPLTGDLAAIGDQVQAVMGELDELLAVGATATADLGTAAADNLAVSVEGIGSIANRIAGVVETLEAFIPGNRDSAAEDLREIADGLAPVPGQLRALGAELETAAGQVEAARISLEPIAGQLATLSDRVADAESDIAAIGRLASDAGERADDALGRLSTDLWLWRALVIVVAVAVVAAAAAGLNALPGPETRR